jgi:hypothetical protein
MGSILGVAVDDFGQRLQIRGSRWEWVRSGMGGSRVRSLEGSTRFCQVPVRASSTRRA